MPAQQSDVITTIELTDPSSQIDQLNEQIDSLNEQLEQSTCHANKRDYAIAIFCGTLSGAFDALWLKSTKVTAKEIYISKDKVFELVDAAQKDRESQSWESRHKSHLAKKAFKVPEDWEWKELYEKANDILAELSHHPTSVGFLATVLIQISRVAKLVKKEDTWQYELRDVNKNNMLHIYLPLILSGFLVWLVRLTKEKDEIKQQMPETLQKLVSFITSNPCLLAIIPPMINWLENLANDAIDVKKAPGKKTGLSDLIFSMSHEIVKVISPDLTEPVEELDALYRKYHEDFDKEIPLVELLEKQAIPVAVNELLTRMCYFLINFGEEMKEKGSLSAVQWKKVLPFGNRTVDRMMTVSCLTFTFADVADASVRAALASRGNFAVFIANFSASINYVGTIRAGIAIVREAAYDKRELQLLHERRLLAEERADLVVDKLNEYEEMLVSIMSKYIVEDLSDYMNGLGDIRQGLIMKDSDLVIRGNLLIQEKFGREAQFRNQAEFDSLMESDTSFVF